MATTIKLKNSVTATNAPSSLVQGEVAINVTDKKVWVGNAATTPIQILGTGSDGNFSALTCTTLAASGVATFSAGTVALPAVTTSGDTNTGVFFPAADTIAFTEGGTEVIRINSSSNVGIGTSSPTTKLEVNGTVTATSVNTQNTFGFKNRLINGAMVIDQRNAGTSVTVNSTTSVFAVDRFSGRGVTSDGVFTLEQVQDVPTGFTNSLKATVTTADASIPATGFYVVQQFVEGYNVSDLGWGTASAQTITVSFWVRSSLTGTFGGSISNSALDRSYPFTYEISAANTFEYKTVTIAGDTTGTWLTDNEIGLRLYFSLGAGSTYTGTAGAWAAARYHGATGQTNIIGTNGATFFITGVQLEKGSTATSFDYRPYGTEFALCQRYFYNVADGASKALGLGTMYTSTNLQGAIFFPVTMRTTPTLSATSGTNYYEFLRNGAADGFNSLTLGNRTSTTIGEIENTTEVSGTVGHSGFIRTDNATVKVSFSAEL